MSARTLSFAQALNEALVEEMERDDRVFIVGEDVAKMGGDFGITRGIWPRWPERAKDTALSESAILGLSVGAAICGLRPVAELMFADFVGVCFDQLANNAAKIHFMFDGKATCPIVVRAATGGGIRCAYHHSQSVEPWLMNVPGLVIVAPSNPAEAKSLLLASIRNENPVLFLEHKMLYNMKGEVPEGDGEAELFKARIVREGRDLTIVATMRMVGLAEKAAEILAREGVEAEVVDPRTLFPLDEAAILASVAKTGRLVAAQEGPKFMGFGAELGAMAAGPLFEYLRAPVERVASLDVPVAFSPPMEDYAMPTADRIVAACRKVMDF